MSNKPTASPVISRPLLVLLLVLPTTFLSSIARGQEPVNKARITINDPADVDGDFHYMGEYQGLTAQPNGSFRKDGVQVVALGDGEFGGMHYAFGLPGTGWNKQDRQALKGQRDGESVMLTGDGIRIEISNGVAKIMDEAGNVLGELPKVERKSPTLGMRAPANALTLFDGVHANAFKNGKISEEGWLQEGTEILSRYRDFTLHAEFRLPYMPYARGQGRSNSGFYLQSSYEVQVLDSFGLEGVKNECGALYRYQQPDQNMCLPPLQWQTYDITFRSPRFDAEGNKIQNARITVLHNGVAVHDDFEVERKTGAGAAEKDTLRAIKLQDHSNPVRFRNIWIIDLENQPSLAPNHGCMDQVAFSSGR